MDLNQEPNPHDKFATHSVYKKEIKNKINTLDYLKLRLFSFTTTPNWNGIAEVYTDHFEYYIETIKK